MKVVYGLRAGLVGQLGIAPEKIRVVNDFVCGAFGSKGALTQRTALVALASRQLGRPVKLVATRDQGFTIAGHRHETKHRICIGASRDGRFTACDDTGSTGRCKGAKVQDIGRRLRSAAPVRGRRMQSVGPKLVPIIGRHARTTAVAIINYLRGAREGQIPR